MLQSIAPGVYAWESKDATRFRAFAVVDQGEVVLVDPLKPDASEEQEIRALGTVKAILLTGAYHERASADLAKAFGVPVYAHPDGLSECESKDVRPFPSDLPAGIEVLPVPGCLPGQVALYLGRDGGILLPGDVWQNLSFREFPLPLRPVLKYIVKLRDGLHPTPPVRTPDPEAFRSAVRAILDRPIERLLVSHGNHLHQGAGALMKARLEQGP